MRCRPSSWCGPEPTAPPARPSRRPPSSRPPVDPQVDQAWRRTSYTALSSAAAAGRRRAAPMVGSEPEDPPSEDEPETRCRWRPRRSSPAGRPPCRPRWPTCPVGATFGSLVHAVLEHADPAAPDHGGDLRAELLEHVGGAAGAVAGASSTVDELADALVAVLRLARWVRWPPDATLRQIGVRDRLTELDFELPLARGDRADHPLRAGARCPSSRRCCARTCPRATRCCRTPTSSTAPATPRRCCTATSPARSTWCCGSTGRYLVVDYKTNWLGAPDRRPS